MAPEGQIEYCHLVRLMVAAGEALKRYDEQEMPRVRVQKGIGSGSPRLYQL